MMIGPLLLLAAAQSAQPASLERPSTARFEAVAGATVRARASVRILAAAKFGAGQSEHVPGALRRNARLIDQEGQQQSAILLEFQ